LDSLYSPLVIQVGKWRRQFTLPSADTAVPDQTLRLPARQAEGDIPRIALTTGNADAMECLVRKLGLDPLEFTPPNGPGRINYFAGREGTARYVDEMNDGAEFPDAEELWSSVDDLRPYDVVLLSCEGDEGYDDNKPDAAFEALFDYTNLGGRVFASHWHQIWLHEGPAPFPEIAEFVDEDDLGEITADVVTSFPKGAARPLPCHRAAPRKLPRARARELGQAAAEVRGERVPALPRMRCLQGSLGVGELQRWAEHGRAEQNADPTRRRSLPKPTKGLGAEHLKFPPLALERLSVLEDGRICYRIKDTDQARLMTPTQFLARLAALVPHRAIHWCASTECGRRTVSGAAASWQ
jgi:hypothetical protein